MSTSQPPRAQRPASETAAALARIDSRLSLAFLALTTAIAIALMSIGATVYVGTIRGERMRMAAVVGRLLSPGIESVRATGAFRVQRMAEEVRRQNPDIVFLRVLDVEGVVAHDGPVPADAELRDEYVRAHAHLSREVDARETEVGGIHVTEIEVPLEGGYRGAWRGVLRVGIRTEATSAALARAAIIIGLSLIALLGLTWPLTRWLGRRFGAPVQTLARDFAGVMDHTPLHVAIEDERGTIDRASRSFLRDFEIDLDASPKTKKLFPPGSIDELEAQHEVQVQLGGEPRTLLVTRFPVLLGHDERVLRSGLVGTDVTAWRRVQSERDRLILAVESTEDGLLVTGADGLASYANPAMCKLTQLRRDQILGRRAIDVLASDDGAREALAKIELTEAWRGRIAAQRADGTTWQCGLIVSPFSGSDLGDQAQVWVARDIGRELTLEAQLRQSQKMEAVGRLAGGIAHDFNNLLTAMIGAAGMLSQEVQLSYDAQSHISMIQEAAQRASELTRQLLAYSRRQRLDMKDLNLDETISNAIKMLKRLIGENVRLEHERAPELWPVRGDAGQLHQVLMNLVINGKDAMPDGGRLVVRARNAHLRDGRAVDGSAIPSGEYVILEVEDNGAGMNEETLAQIFEPFFTTKPVGRGTGLGLATVLGIVQQSGGWLQVDSAIGTGTCFRILFPRVISRAPVDTPETSPPDEPGRGGRVLLVEDDPLVRRVLHAGLEQGGYRVTVAMDGQEALDLIARKGVPEIIIIDLVMPGISGAALFKLLRSRGIEVPVVFMSGYSEEAVDHSTEWPDVPLLQKPLTAEVLLEAVRRALAAEPRPERATDSV